MHKITVLSNTLPYLWTSLCIFWTKRAFCALYYKCNHIYVCRYILKNAFFKKIFQNCLLADLWCCPRMPLKKRLRDFLCKIWIHTHTEGSEKPTNIHIYTDMEKPFLNEIWKECIYLIFKSNINSSGKDEKLNLYCDTIRIRRGNQAE